MSNNVSVSSDKVTVTLTSLTYDPNSDSWKFIYTATTNFPYKIVKVNGNYNGNASNIQLENNCGNATKCIQHIYASIPGCTGLSGTLSLTLVQVNLFFQLEKN